MQVVQQPGQSTRRVYAGWMLIAVSALLVLASIGFGAYAFFSANPTHTISLSVTHKKAVAAANQVDTIVPGIAQQYIHALITQNYQTMWTMLAPQIQAQWTSEKAFATFWQKRFQDYTLQDFALGKTSLRGLWVNPETMQQYNNVMVLSVSLQLTLKATTVPTSTIPPEDLNPSQVLQNLPFVVEHVPATVSSKEQWLVLAGGPADLEAPILPPITAVATTVKVPIMMYHHVSDVKTTNVLDRSLTVSTTIFGQQLDYLKAQGYHTITFNQLFNALYYGMTLPIKPIILTFDDGYEDNYQFVYPALVKRGYTGMFYIISGKVNWTGQMSWGQLREMLRNGMQIGSHTVHHVDMGQVLQNSPEQAQQELQLSRLTLQKNLGVVIQHFCYPSGEPFRHGTPLLRQEIVTMLAQNGYVSATTDPGMTGFEQSSQSPFVLLRTRVDGRATLLNFEQSLPW